MRNQIASRLDSDIPCKGCGIGDVEITVIVDPDTSHTCHINVQLFCIQQERMRAALIALHPVACGNDRALRSDIIACCGTFNRSTRRINATCARAQRHNACHINCAIAERNVAVAGTNRHSQVRRINIRAQRRQHITTRVRTSS